MRGAPSKGLGAARSDRPWAARGTGRGARRTAPGRRAARGGPGRGARRTPPGRGARRTGARRAAPDRPWARRAAGRPGARGARRRPVQFDFAAPPRHEKADNRCGRPSHSPADSATALEPADSAKPLEPADSAKVVFVFVLPCFACPMQPAEHRFWSFLLVSVCIQRSTASCLVPR